MKTEVKLFIIISFVLFSCNGNTPFHLKNAEELRRELKIKEQTNYNDYLSVQYKLDVKFWSGKDVIRGTVSNSASIARFKDIVLTVKFLTETDTELKSVDYVVYKFVEPNSKTPFEIQTNSPSATKKIGVKVKSAVAVD